MNNDAVSDTILSLVHSYKLAMRSSLRANEIGLNAMHVQCLPYINRSEGCTANDLVTFFMRDKAQIARLVKEMIANNWITKTANPADKRSQLLALTEEGRELVVMISDAQQKVQSSMQENLSIEELNAFTRTADIISQNLRNLKR